MQDYPRLTVMSEKQYKFLQALKSEAKRTGLVTVRNASSYKGCVNFTQYAVNPEGFFVISNGNESIEFIGQLEDVKVMKPVASTLQEWEYN